MAVVGSAPAAATVAVAAVVEMEVRQPFASAEVQIFGAVDGNMDVAEQTSASAAASTTNASEAKQQPENP